MVPVMETNLLLKCPNQKVPALEGDTVLPVLILTPVPQEPLIVLEANMVATLGPTMAGRRILLIAQVLPDTAPRPHMDLLAMVVVAPQVAGQVKARPITEEGETQKGNGASGSLSTVSPNSIPNSPYCLRHLTAPLM